MNCCLWNPRGIQAPGRKTSLIDLFNKSHANLVGFMETKKETIADSYLKSIVGNRIFEWRTLPAIGTAGGIAVGVDLDFYDIISWDIKSFSVSVIVKLKNSNITVRVVTVYGSSYEEKKEAFISELHELFVDYHGHTLIGGDFNLVRFQKDKSNGVIDHKWSDKFNAWVKIWSLLEVKLSNRRFTWGNN